MKEVISNFLKLLAIGMFLYMCFGPPPFTQAERNALNKQFTEMVLR